MLHYLPQFRHNLIDFLYFFYYYYPCAWMGVYPSNWIRCTLNMCDFMIATHTQILKPTSWLLHCNGTILLYPSATFQTTNALPSHPRTGGRRDSSVYDSDDCSDGRYQGFLQGPRARSAPTTRILHHPTWTVRHSQELLQAGTVNFVISCLFKRLELL